MQMLVPSMFSLCQEYFETDLQRNTQYNGTFSLVLAEDAYHTSEFNFSVGCFECLRKPKLATLAVPSILNRIFEECITKLTSVFHHQYGALLRRAIDRMQLIVFFHFVNETMSSQHFFSFLFCL